MLSPFSPASRTALVGEDTNTRRFWTGSLERVRSESDNDSSPRSLTFEQVLGPKDDLKHAVFVSAYYKPEWLFPKVTAGAPLLLIVGEQEDQPTAQPEVYTRGKRPDTYVVATERRVHEAASGGMH